MSLLIKREILSEEEGRFYTAELVICIGKLGVGGGGRAQDELHTPRS